MSPVVPSAVSRLVPCVVTTWCSPADRISTSFSFPFEVEGSKVAAGSSRYSFSSGDGSCGTQ